MPLSIVHPSKDLFTALDLQPLYARYVKAPVNPNAQLKTFVSDIKDELADGRATPGGKNGPSTPNDTAGINSPTGGVLQLQQQKGQPSMGNQKKTPKPKLFSSVYEELLQEIPGQSAKPTSFRCVISLKLPTVYLDPVPLPPNESLLDIPYHRYSNHLDDPNFQFTSLVTSDKSKMALRLQIGHAQGVNGKVIHGLCLKLP